MINLTIVNQDGRLLVESRQVAEMVERQHNELMKSIRQYCEYLTQGDFTLSEFFIESIYQDSTGRTLPCYLLTRKGCDMVANKMTGEKGVLFTATYVTRFEEMEQELNKPMTQLEILAQAAQALVEQDKAIKQLTVTQTKQAEELQGMRDVISLDTTSWREDTKKLLNKIAHKIGDITQVRELRSESYKLLDGRMGVSLQTRLTNKRRRMADEGICKSARDKLNVIDVIAEDKKLIEGYTAIIKEMAIKYGVSL